MRVESAAACAFAAASTVANESATRAESAAAFALSASAFPPHDANNTTPAANIEIVTFFIFNCFQFETQNYINYYASNFKKT
jgi:hypothetical protein